MNKTTTAGRVTHNKQKLGLRKQGKRKEAEFAPGGVLLFPFSGLVLTPMLAGVERKRATAHRVEGTETC